MGDYPKGGLIGKSVHFFRFLTGLRIGLYAANAGFFIVLAVFPALLLLLGLLRYTPLEVERLTELLQGVLPDALLEHAEELILLTYDASSGTAIGISALATLWSASRGIYGLIAGLNAVYGVTEDRNYFYRRGISVLYTFGFLLVLILTLGLHVFGSRLLHLGGRNPIPFLRFLSDAVNLRFFLLLTVQTLLFAAMFKALPNRRSSFRECLPGALLGAAGWLTFSNLYSVYVEHFARLTNVYGSVYALSLSMLWLYCCISIVFYGGVLNRILSRRKT